MIRQRFKWWLSILLAFALLMGFSSVQAADTDLFDQVDDIENIEELIPVDVTVDDLKNVIEAATERGDIADDKTSRSLLTHLTALDHYTNQGQWQKAVEHMDGFGDMLRQYHQMEQISTNTAKILTVYKRFLTDQWDTAFDSNRAMDTIKGLSVDIGPRVAGSEEERQAADYLKNQFESYGYDVAIQEFDIRDTLKLQLTINDEEEIALGTARGSIETDENGITGNLYDAGLGLPDDFSEEANGNIALIERGDISYWEKVQNATEAGATGVVIYDNEESLTPVRPGLGNNESTIPVVGIQKTDGEALLAKMNEEEVEANLYVRTQTNQTSQNVIAVKKPENIENPEIVYISAHYDSVPFSPGANDDASGTSAIVELARIMKDLPTDKELRFIAFGAEEIGLVGSHHYVAQLPQEEIDRSEVNFQLEMLGANYEPGSYLAVNTVDGQENILWDYTNAAFDKLGYDKEKLILFRRGSSDHVPFHNEGIPAAAFNMGTKDGGLEPEYHTSYDTFENVSQERIQFAGDIMKNAIFDYLADHASTESEEEMQEAS